ncbi:hypothetical protein LCGC14_0363780 [marine sediment metagenome]|uniref:Uncharacterized protein n=1 Tax=marine sediment metagenome TaxID=412755 RepID=A0A0F9TCU2_9ZZZZ
MNEYTEKAQRYLSDRPIGIDKGRCSGIYRPVVGDPDDPGRRGSDSLATPGSSCDHWRTHYLGGLGTSSGVS